MTDNPDSVTKLEASIAISVFVAVLGLLGFTAWSMKSCSSQATCYNSCNGNLECMRFCGSP